MSITTITRTSIFDQLCAAVDEARIKSAADLAWLNAISAAWAWLLEEDTYEVVNAGTPHAAVRVPSRSKPGLIYTANGECQCRAYELHNPCMHRAASRLVRNALAFASAPAPIIGPEAHLRIADAYAYEAAMAEIDELFEPRV